MGPSGAQRPLEREPAGWGTVGSTPAVLRASWVTCSGAWVMMLLIKPDEVPNESTVRVIQVGSCMGGGLMFQGEGVDF